MRQMERTGANSSDGKWLLATLRGGGEWAGGDRDRLVMSAQSQAGETFAISPLICREIP